MGSLMTSASDAFRNCSLVYLPYAFHLLNPKHQIPHDSFMNIFIGENDTFQFIKSTLSLYLHNILARQQSYDTLWLRTKTLVSVNKKCQILPWTGSWAFRILIFVTDFFPIISKIGILRVIYFRLYLLMHHLSWENIGPTPT